MGADKKNTSNVWGIVKLARDYVVFLGLGFAMGAVFFLAIMLFWSWAD